jgi:hypothetical protein
VKERRAGEVCLDSVKNTFLACKKTKRRAIFQEDRHSGKIVLQESMTFTIFCGQNFLDIQDRVSYGSTMKSNVLSNIKNYQI